MSMPEQITFINDRTHALAVLNELDMPGRAKFREWLESNWAIWDEFAKLADQMRKKGRAYYSARAVIHVLRWHRNLRDTTETDLKINNNVSAKLARLYNAVRGADFFRTRENGGRVPGLS